MRSHIATQPPHQKQTPVGSPPLQPVGLGLDFLSAPHPQEQANLQDLTLGTYSHLGAFTTTLLPRPKLEAIKGWGE